MLDTNIVSLFLRGDQNIASRLADVPTTDIVVSAITRAELLYGLAKRPEAIRTARLVRAFLDYTQTLDWRAETADVHAAFRVECERQGLSLSPPDMLIAAHAQATGRVLVTNDRAFTRIPELATEDWTTTQGK